MNNKLLFTWVLYLLLSSCPLNADTNNNDSIIYKEAIQLLEKQYYDKNKINQILTPINIHYCENTLQHLFNKMPPYYTSIKCLLDKLDDPHTKILLPIESNSEQKHIQAKAFEGFGIVLDPLIKGNILEVIPNSPASTNISPNDVITAINEIPLQYFTNNELQSLLETPVTVDKLTLSLKRDQYHFDEELLATPLPIIHIKVKPIQYDIVYIQISSLLSKKLVVKLNNILQQPLLKKSRGLILDLRNNAGGLLKNGILIADLMLPIQQTIVSINSNQPTPKVIPSKYSPIYSKPLVVLINHNTASSAEILTAALKDNKRATVIGEKSYGKGSIQKISHLSNKASLHITVSEFISPNNNPINSVGIHPQVQSIDPLETLQTAIDRILSIQ